MLVYTLPTHRFFDRVHRATMLAMVDCRQRQIPRHSEAFEPKLHDMSSGYMYYDGHTNVLKPPNSIVTQANIKKAFINQG